MSAPKFSAEFGPILPMTPAQTATARARITEAARDADDAELLCSVLGLDD